MMQTGAEVQSHSQASFSRGDLGLVGDGTHHVTHEQGGEVVGEEHQNTQRSAHDLSNAGRDVKFLVQFVGYSPMAPDFWKKATMIPMNTSIPMTQM